MTSLRALKTAVASLPPGVAYWVQVGVIVLMTLLMLSAFLYHSYRETEAALEQSSNNEALILANRLDSTLRRVEATLAFARKSYLSEVLAATDPAQQAGASAYLQGHLRSLEQHFDEMVGIIVIDSDGKLILNSQNAFAQVDVRDREYFLSAKAQPQPGMLFSETLTNKLSGEPSVIAHEAILDADGNFHGLVASIIRLPSLQNVFSSLAIGKHGMISIRRSDDSRLVMRWPDTAQMLNQPAPENPPFRHIQAGQKAGVVRYVDASDKVERIFAFRSLDPYPFFVMVGRSTDEQFGPWRRVAANAVAITLIALAVLLLMQHWLRRSRKLLAQTERQFNTLVDSRHDAVCTWTPDTTLLSYNTQYAKFLGMSTDSLKGMRWISFVPEDQQAAVLTQIDPEQGVRSDEREMVRADGSRCWVRWVDLPLLDEHGQCVHFQSIGQDISAQKQSDLRLRQLAQAVEQSPECIVITDTQARIEYVNEAFTHNTGYSLEEVLGLNPKVLNAGKTPQSTYETLWATLSQGEVWRGEFHNTRKDGSDYVELATIAPLKQADGTITHYVAVKEDITVRRQSEELIHRLAYFDTLTELPNRTLLWDRLKQAIMSSRRSGAYGMLLLLDIDHFKMLNDTQGHEVGDTLLRQVAKRLLTVVRDEDTVARQGDDDFAVVIEALGEDQTEAIAQAERIAEKIHRRLSAPYDLDMASGCYRSTPSIGIAIFEGLSTSAEVVLKQAEVALYKAKQDGRNIIRFFSPAMQAVVDARAEMELGLREAIATGGFKLFYQPQVDRSGEIIGAEALLRWFPPHGPMISPTHFIPLAEETGLIVPLGEWVLNAACAQLRQWQSSAATQDLVLAVNVSAKQFHQPDFVEQVRSAIARSGITPSRLKIELTESAVLGDIETTVSRMQQIKALGVKFALDDFGTGYSSLSYLKRLPFDQLKIDQAFVRDMAYDNSSDAIVRAILAMSRSLELEVIAEGVETYAQHDLLQRRGCELYQGYLFGKPEPIEHWSQQLKALI